MGADECKVRKMWIILECQYITEDSEVGVYLPAVQKIKKPEPESFFRKAFLVVLRLALSALLTFPYAVWSIEYAFLQRGYKAYGGEYLFIPFVFYVIFLILGVFAKLGNRGDEFESLPETHAADTGGTAVCRGKSLGD